MAKGDTLTVAEAEQQVKDVSKQLATAESQVGSIESQILSRESQLAGQESKIRQAFIPGTIESQFRLGSAQALRGARQQLRIEQDVGLKNIFSARAELEPVRVQVAKQKQAIASTRAQSREVERQIRAIKTERKIAMKKADRLFEEQLKGQIITQGVVAPPGAIQSLVGGGFLVQTDTGVAEFKQVPITLASGGTEFRQVPGTFVPKGGDLFKGIEPSTVSVPTLKSLESVPSVSVRERGLISRKFPKIGDFFERTEQRIESFLPERGGGLTPEGKIPFIDRGFEKVSSGLLKGGETISRVTGLERIPQPRIGRERAVEFISSGLKFATFGSGGIIPTTVQLTRTLPVTTGVVFTGGQQAVREGSIVTELGFVTSKGEIGIARGFSLVEQLPKGGTRDVTFARGFVGKQVSLTKKSGEVIKGVQRQREFFGVQFGGARPKDLFIKVGGDEGIQAFQKVEGFVSGEVGAVARAPRGKLVDFRVPIGGRGGFGISRKTTIEGFRGLGAGFTKGDITFSSGIAKGASGRSASIGAVRQVKTPRDFFTVTGEGTQASNLALQLGLGKTQQIVRAGVQTTLPRVAPITSTLGVGVSAPKLFAGTPGRTTTQPTLRQVPVSTIQPSFQTQFVEQGFGRAPGFAVAPPRLGIVPLTRERAVTRLGSGLLSAQGSGLDTQLGFASLSATRGAFAQPLALGLGEVTKQQPQQKQGLFFGQPTSQDTRSFFSAQPRATAGGRFGLIPPPIFPILGGSGKKKRTRKGRKIRQPPVRPSFTAGVLDLTATTQLDISPEFGVNPFEIRRKLIKKPKKKKKAKKKKR